MNGERVCIKFRKVYDCVDWEFLVIVLDKMGFEARWIGQTKRYVMFAWVLALVNGSKIGEFNMEKGLREDCLLSPLLFHLVAETLLIFMNYFDENSWLEGVHIHGVMESTTGFQYADNTILFL